MEQNKKSMIVILTGLFGFMVILGVGGYLLFMRVNKPPIANRPNLPVITNPCAGTMPAEPITIEITAKGVAQQNALICHGQGVRWINKDDKSSYTLASDSQLPGALRLKDFSAIAPGEEVTVYFESPETIPYDLVSDHGSFSGTLIVK